MKIQILVLVLVGLMLPLAVNAGPGKDGGKEFVTDIDFCSDWWEYTEGKHNELRHACFRLRGEEDQTDITAFVRCKYGHGTCCESDCYVSFCQTDNPLPGAVQVINKNQVIVDLRPEDCDFSINTEGTQFSAKTNGQELRKHDFGKSYRRVKEDQRTCVWITKNGSHEYRSADVEAVIEGVPVEGAAFIEVWSAGSLLETCSD